ncbi:NAD(P)-dependent oxidoreductase [Oceanivirga miroungae]|uniref:D-lactate dehydrogenase n=1 Tax=Oceanivirga miroungae TaxID=1130046 RepID=A0A6I8M668_9FUSO|nr:NAD(P)-dependent oxidoreductase [Oceanivirga miroungae]VWL84851.1 hypothetical protein OMES3154_00105 [Oceanivirga miroungae]
MRIKVFAARPDEFEAFSKYEKKYGHELSLESVSLKPETVHLAKGYEGVAFLGNCTVNREVLKKLSEYNIKYIASRSAGVNNIDFSAANEFGIKVSNVSAYSPNSVSEFAVLSALSLLRNLPKSLKRSNINDYSLPGLIGREMRNQTVGIIGTGNIGIMAAKAYKGFGAKVIAYDLYPKENIDDLLTYHSLDYVLKNSDIISLHCPLTEANHYMINKESIKNMKDNVVIINTARGGLINTRDLIDGIYDGKILAAALDVYENEVGILHVDHKNKMIKDSLFNELKSLSNVIVTPHYAFYTDEAVSNMVEYSLDSLKQFEKTKKSSYQVNK